MNYLPDYVHSIGITLEKNYLTPDKERSTKDPRENIHWLNRFTKNEFKIGLVPYYDKKTKEYKYNLRILFADISSCILSNGKGIETFGDIKVYLTEVFLSIKNEEVRNFYLENIVKARIIRTDYFFRIIPTESQREFFHGPFRENITKLPLIIKSCDSIEVYPNTDEPSTVYFNYPERTLVLYDEEYHSRNEDYIKAELRISYVDNLRKAFKVGRKDLEYPNWDNLDLSNVKEYFNKTLGDILKALSPGKKKIKRDTFDSNKKTVEKFIEPYPYIDILDSNDKIKRNKKALRKEGREMKEEWLYKLKTKGFITIDKRIKKTLREDFSEIYSKLYPEPEEFFQRKPFTDYRFSERLIKDTFKVELKEKGKKKTINDYNPIYINKERTKGLEYLRKRGLTEEDIDVIKYEVDWRIKRALDKISTNAELKTRKKNFNEIPKGRRRPFFDFFLDRFTEKKDLKRALTNVLLDPRGEDLKDFFIKAEEFLELFVDKRD